MKKIQRKLLAWLITVCVIGSMVSITTFATENVLTAVDAAYSDGVEELDPVEVYDLNGEKWSSGFTTVTDALTAMLIADVHDEGYTVMLREDVTEADCIKLNCGSSAVAPFHVTVDVNGHTLTGSNALYMFFIDTNTWNAGTTLNITSGQEGGEIGTATNGVYAQSTAGDMYYVTIRNITLHGAVKGAIQMIENCTIDGFVYYSGTASEWTSGAVNGTIKDSTVSGSAYGVQLTSGHIIVENSNIAGTDVGIDHGFSATSDTSLTINGDGTVVTGGKALFVESGSSGSRTTTINGGSFAASSTVAISQSAPGTLTMTDGIVTAKSGCAVLVGDWDADYTDEEITVNLTGGTLTGGNWGGIEVADGTLHVSGDVEIIGTAAKGVGVYGGTLNVSDGDISSRTTVAIGAWGGDVNISGGTMTAGGYSAVEIWNDGSAVNITGGDVDGNGNVGICIGAGTLYIADGAEISGTHGVELCYEESASVLDVNIEGGTVTGSDYGVYVECGSVSYGGERVVGPTINGALYGSDSHIATSGYFTTTTNLTVADGSYLTSTVNKDGYYQVGVGAEPTTDVTYTVTTTLDDTAYRSGDTITATVSVTAEEGSDIGSFNLTLDYDDAFLDLGTMTAGASFASGTSINTTAGAVGFTHTGTAVPIGETATTLLTVTFTVKADVSADGTDISVKDVTMTPVGVNANTEAVALVSDSATIIDTVVITLTAGDNGTYTGASWLAVDSGSTLAYVVAMTGYSAPVGNPGYGFAGWYNDTDLLSDTSTFTENTAITAKFAPDSFAFTSDGTNTATVTPGAGIVDGEVSYLTDATFSVEAPTGYFLNGVSYTVGDGEGMALTATTSTATTGTYTISGSAITGAVNVIVSVVEYYEVTFQSGTGSTMTTVTYYAKEGSGNTGLYASLDAMASGTTTDVEPTYAIDTGYRVADSAWMTGDQVTSFGAILSADITADTTYVVNTVKTYAIAFAAGDNGSVATTEIVTYDTGATVTLPTVNPDTGYVFAGWTSSTSTALDTDATGFTASEDVTYTAIFTPSAYPVTFPTLTGVGFTDVTGLTEGKATYLGDNVTFKISETNVEVTAVSYTVSGGEAVAIGAVNGVYTIPSTAINNDVSVTVTALDVYAVTFTAGSNGVVFGTTGFGVTSGDTLTSIAAVTILPNTGYTFSHWTNSAGTTVSDPTAVTVSGDETYTANFKTIQYTIGAEGGNITFVSGYGSYATYGTDVTFTIAGTSGELITQVRVGETVLTATNGVYTLPYTSFGTSETISLTITTLSGVTTTFIDLDTGYLANVSEASGRKIMVLSVSGDTTGGTTYKLSNNVAMYWSEKYEAYVAIVDESETATTLCTGMTSEATAATAIDYSGDLNGDGQVLSDDAGVVNDILHGTRTVTTTDMQLLMADVTGSCALATDDVTTIMNIVLGIV